MTNTPNDNTAAETTDNGLDDGLIEFVLPEDLPHQLVIVKNDEDFIVARPLPLFTDELLPPFILGETDIRVELSHLVMLQNAAIALLAQSKREILIVTPDLEHARFDNDELLTRCLPFPVQVGIPSHDC